MAASAGIAKTRIKESRIVDAEFTDQWIERHHFGGEIGRHLHRFLGGQNIELTRIEDQASILTGPDWLPEFIDRITATAIHIDDAGMTLGAIADKAIRALTRQIDAQRNT